MELEAQQLSIQDLVQGNAATWPDSEAVICGSERITFGQLASRSLRSAASLRSMGVGPGDRVVWLGKNCHAVIELLISCGHLGAILCPANWRGSAEELTFLLEDLVPRVVFYDEAVLPADLGSIREQADVQQWIPCSRYEAVMQATADPAPARRSLSTDPVLILYTGAWQGTPSGSMLTHVNLIAQSLVWARGWAFDRRTVYLACGPLFHIATWMSALPALHVGGKVVVAEQADPAQICRLISAEGCTNGLVLPQTIEKIVEVNRDRSYDLSSFRSFVRHPDWDDMVAMDPSPLGRSPGGYGQTEVTGSALISGFGPRPDDLTSGVPSPAARVLVADEADREVAVGEVGEILVGGPLVHAGYWNRPLLNAARMRSGWWHTGDLGRRNDDGTVSFIGPKSRMIKSGMENIYPAEIERCLEQHPDIGEAAVIGVPDERWIQQVRAIVTPIQGRRIDESEVIDWCRQRLASYKKPRSVVFIDGLPRANGLKDYDALDLRFGGGGYPGGSTSYLHTAKDEISEGEGVSSGS